jgi:hypothetical protein
MDAYTMLKVAAWLFGIAAVGGVVMAAMRFSGTPRPPDALAVVHGLLAGSGLTLMLYAALVVGVSSLAKVSIALFLIAAVGGLVVNLMYHQKQLALPKGMMVGHGALAVLAYVLLLMSLRGPTI